MHAADTPVTVKSLEAAEEVLAAVPELTEDSVVRRCGHVLIYHSTKYSLLVVQFCGTLNKHFQSLLELTLS